MKLTPLRKPLGLALLSALCLSAIAHSASATTLTVTNLNDSGVGSLRQAISNAASNGDVIVFAAGVTGTITLTSGELFFTKSLTIAGPGAVNLTVSGNNTSRVFSVLGGEIIISGLRIADGFVTGNPNSLNAGGGILNYSARLTVQDCEIANNSHTGGPDSGGFAIAGQGGGVWHIAGGDPTTGGRLLLQNCLFTGNTAIGGTGSNAGSPGGAGGDAAPGPGAAASSSSQAASTRSRFRIASSRTTSRSAARVAMVWAPARAGEAAVDRAAPFTSNRILCLP